MKKKLLISATVIAFLFVIFFVVRGNKGSKDANILVEVQRGEFIVDIETTGELEAKNSVEILGPSNLRNFRVYNVTIQSILKEGTVVKKGDWIATLDPSDLTTKIKDREIELEQKESQYIQTQLDTTLQMRQARDELINLEFAVEEKEIILNQSKYEPPATIKQAEINLDKAKRALVQAQENYKIKLHQNKAKMREATVKKIKDKREYDDMVALIKSFNIIAPEDGMLIYRKGNDGRPMKEGSQISTWNPVVATLPDLSKMLSKTYVNEVDVRKVKAGQMVDVGLDAFPEKKLKGRVINVANVGEQKPNSDAKVFQVNIEVLGSDDLLRPAMTTSNKIIAKEIDSTLFLPLECLHNHNDSITYVFKKDGLNITKQEIQVGETNSNDAVILAGLEENDRVYLSVPGEMDSKEVRLLPEMDGKRNKPKQPEEDPAFRENRQRFNRENGGERRNGNRRRNRQGQ